MVSSITSNPYNTYLSQLQGAGQSASAPTTGTNTQSAGTSTNGQSLVSSLLGGGYTPELLSLLQGGNTGNFNAITDLLGGTGTNAGLTSLYTNLYDSQAAAALTQAQDNAGGQTPVTPPASSGSGASGGSANQVTALIAAQTQASIAYNQTLQQNVADTVKSIVNA